MKFKKKLLSPTGDTVFQTLFGEQENESFIIPFIQSIIKRPIETIDLTQNTIFRPKHVNDKKSIVDVLAVLQEGTKVNIEMQKVSKDFDVRRFLYYWSITYTRGFESGGDYKDLHDTICILILKETYPGFEDFPYHSIWRVKCENKEETVLTSALELHIIQLGKLQEACGKDKDLEDWLWFIADPQNEKVKKSMEQKQEIKHAMHKLREMSEDEKMQIIAFYEDLADHDRASQKARELEAEQRKKELDMRIKKNQEALEKGQAAFAKAKEEMDKQQEEMDKQQEEMDKQQEEMDKQQEEMDKQQQEIEKSQAELKKEQAELAIGQVQLAKDKEKLEKNKAEVLKEGSEKTTKDMVKRMLDNGIPEDTIIQIANITKEMLENIRQE